MRPWATFTGNYVTLHTDAGVRVLTAEDAEALAADLINAARYIKAVPELDRLGMKGGK